MLPDEVTYGALLGARFPRPLALRMLQWLGRGPVVETNGTTMGKP